MKGSLRTLWNPQWLRFGTEAITMSSGFGSWCWRGLFHWGCHEGWTSSWRLGPAACCLPVSPHVRVCFFVSRWLSRSPLPAALSLSVYTCLSPAGLPQQASPQSVRQIAVGLNSASAGLGYRVRPWELPPAVAAQGLVCADSSFSWKWAKLQVEENNMKKEGKRKGIKGEEFKKSGGSLPSLLVELLCHKLECVGQYG